MTILETFPGVLIAVTLMYVGVAVATGVAASMATQLAMRLVVSGATAVALVLGVVMWVVIVTNRRPRRQPGAVHRARRRHPVRTPGPGPLRPVGSAAGAGGSPAARSERRLGSAPGDAPAQMFAGQPAPPAVAGQPRSARGTASCRPTAGLGPARSVVLTRRTTRPAARSARSRGRRGPGSSVTRTASPGAQRRASPTVDRRRSRRRRAGAGRRAAPPSRPGREPGDEQAGAGRCRSAARTRRRPRPGRTPAAAPRPGRTTARCRTSDGASHAWTKRQRPDPGSATSLCRMPVPAESTCARPASTTCAAPVESVWTSAPSSTQVTISSSECGCSG